MLLHGAARAAAAAARAAPWSRGSCQQSMEPQAEARSSSRIQARKSKQAAACTSKQPIMRTAHAAACAWLASDCKPRLAMRANQHAAAAWLAMRANPAHSLLAAVCCIIMLRASHGLVSASIAASKDTSTGPCLLHVSSVCFDLARHVLDVWHAPSR
jgi:hypothetical protein